jgi:hypothetical protein
MGADAEQPGVSIWLEVDLNETSSFGEFEFEMGSRYVSHTELIKALCTLRPQPTGIDKGFAYALMRSGRLEACDLVPVHWTLFLTIVPLSCGLRKRPISINAP